MKVSKRSVEIAFVFTYVTIWRIGMAQRDCGPFCTCGANTTLPVETKASVVIYQLTGKKVTIFHAARPLVAPGTSLLVNSKIWVPGDNSSGNASEIPSNSTLQVSTTSEKNSVTIDPMDEHVSGIQLRYRHVIIVNNLDRTFRRYDSPSITALVGIVPSVKAPSYVSSKANCLINVTIDVGGIPTANLSLMRNGVDVESDRYQLDQQSLTLGPVKDSDTGNYTIRASNCFDSASTNFHLDILMPASVINVSARTDSNPPTCGRTVVLECIALDYQKPKITWMLNNTPLYSSSNVRIEDTRTEGNNHYRSVLHLVQFNKTDSGVYSCTARDSVSPGCTISNGTGQETMNLNVSCISGVTARVTDVTNETVEAHVILPHGEENTINSIDLTVSDDDTRSTLTCGLPTGDNETECSNVTGHVNFAGRFKFSHTSKPTPRSTFTRSSDLIMEIYRLTPKTPYNFSLIATYKEGLKTEPSIPINVTTEGPPDEVDGISDEKEGCESTEFKILIPDNDWGEPVDEYKVLWPDGSIETIKGTIHRQHLVRFDGLSAGETYVIIIQAKNIYGFGNSSIPFTIKTETLWICRDRFIVIGIVVSVAAVGIVIIVTLLVYKKKKQLVTRSPADDKGNMTTQKGNKIEYTSGSDKVEAYAESGPSVRREEPEAATKGGKASKTAKNPTTDVYAQPDKSKKTAKNGLDSSVTVEMYAQPEKSKKQKRDQQGDQYAQVDKDKKKQKEELRYAQLDESAMKKSPAVKMDSSVAYSDVNVVQPRARAEDK